MKDNFKLAVASGKGGTGKTFLSTNIFSIFRKNKHDVILVDCDAEAPDTLAFFKPELESVTEVTHQVPVIDADACTFCSKCHEYCNYNAIFILPPMKIIKVIEDLCHGCGACTVACTFDAITEKSVPLGQVSTWKLNGNISMIESRMNIGVMTPVTVIKHALKQTDNKQNEIVILDSPPGTSCPFIHTVANADYVLLVTEPTPFGLSDLKQSVETLRDINKPFGVIINRSDLGNDDVREYLKKENIPLLLEIPFDKEISELYSTGSLITEKKPLLASNLYEVVKNIMIQYGNSSNQR